MGLINFLALLVDLGRLHMRPIQHWLASSWDHTLPSIDMPLRPVLLLAQVRPKQPWYSLGHSRLAPPPRDDALCPVRALKAYLEKAVNPSFVNNRDCISTSKLYKLSFTLLYFKIVC